MHHGPESCGDFAQRRDRASTNELREHSGDDDRAKQERQRPREAQGEGVDKGYGIRTDGEDAAFNPSRRGLRSEQPQVDRGKTISPIARLTAKHGPVAKVEDG